MAILNIRKDRRLYLDRQNRLHKKHTKAITILKPFSHKIGLDPSLFSPGVVKPEKPRSKFTNPMVPPIPCDIPIEFEDSKTQAPKPKIGVPPKPVPAKVTPADGYGPQKAKKKKHLDFAYGPTKTGSDIQDLMGWASEKREQAG